MTVDGSSSTFATELTDPDPSLDHDDDSSDCSDHVSIFRFKHPLANVAPPALSRSLPHAFSSSTSRPPPPPPRHPYPHSPHPRPADLPLEFNKRPPPHDTFPSKRRHEPDSPAFLPPEEHARRQRLIEQYAELTSKRSTLFDAFSKAQANRHDIQNLRHIKDEAERKFITAIETALATSPAARQLFKSLQDARVQCQEAESRFYDVFEELKEGHEDVDQQERRFYLAAIGVPDAPLVQTRKSENPASEDDFLLRGISGDRPEIIHPLFEKLRDAFRELQLARELLVNTRMKRDTLLLKKSQPLSEDGFNLLETYGDAGRRKALELKQVALMTEADKEQLQDYTNLEQEAKADIELYTEKVKRLQIECRDKGVLPTDSIFQEDVLKIDPPQEEIRLSPGAFESNESGTLAHPVFPLLLSNPTHVLNERFPQTALQSLKVAISLPNNVSYKRQRIQDAAREANIHSLLSTMKSEDKDTFVNHWLLHKLHQSAMEAELLWTTFRTRLKILDIDRWQRDVLQFWWRDGESSSDFSIGGDRDTNYPSNSAVLSIDLETEEMREEPRDEMQEKTGLRLAFKNTDMKLEILEIRSESGNPFRGMAEHWP